MCSEKQLLANRENALKSTGPKTMPGKSRSAQNALKHGMCTSSLLPTEDQLSYDMFCDEMRDSLQPKSPAESMLAERITQITWRLRRLPAAEAEIFNHLQIQPTPEDQEHEPLTSAEQLALCFIHRDDRTNPFTRLQRYEAHLQRSLSTCYKQLRDLQEHREAHPRTYDPYEYFGPTGRQPSATLNNDPPQPGTTNNEPQTTNEPELQNEPISPTSPTESDPQPAIPALVTSDPQPPAPSLDIQSPPDSHYNEPPIALAQLAPAKKCVGHCCSTT